MYGDFISVKDQTGLPAMRPMHVWVSLSRTGCCRRGFADVRGNSVKIYMDQE